MPVIRPADRSSPIATLREHLTDLLVSELLGERSRMGPVIFELPTADAIRVDVIVVWEAWKSLPVETRSQVVRDAYERFAHMLEANIHIVGSANPKESLAAAPASVLCATWEDLASSELLPYKIQPSASDERVDPDDVRLMMIEAGAIWTPLGVQLRFPTREMARDAYHRLMEEMPEARWEIVESSFGRIMD